MAARTRPTAVEVTETDTLVQQLPEASTAALDKKKKLPKKGGSCGWPGTWSHHGVCECAWGRCGAGAELGGGARGCPGSTHF
eukprot:6355343-Prymnesium_polylepis.1